MHNSNGTLVQTGVCDKNTPERSKNHNFRKLVEQRCSKNILCPEALCDIGLCRCESINAICVANADRIMLTKSLLRERVRVLWWFSGRFSVMILVVELWAVISDITVFSNQWPHGNYHTIRCSQRLITLKSPYYRKTRYLTAKEIYMYAWGLRWILTV